MNLTFSEIICLDDVLRDQKNHRKNSVSFQVIYGFPCPTDPGQFRDSSLGPESELKWIDVTTNAILSSSENLILSLEDRTASGMLKTDQLEDHPHRQETFITAEFLNTKVKMILDVLTPRRININIHVSTEIKSLSGLGGHIWPLWTVHIFRILTTKRTSHNRFY